MLMDHCTEKSASVLTKKESQLKDLEDEPCLKEGHCSYAFPSGDVKLEILYLQFIFKLFIVNDQKADYNNEEYQCLFLLLHIADVVLVQFYY